MYLYMLFSPVMVHLIFSSITSKLSMRIQTRTSLPQRWYVLNDVFKQLQEMLLLSYFPNLCLQTFCAFLNVSHVIVHPKIIIQNKYQKQNKLAFTNFVLQNPQSYQLLCGLFHFRTWHCVIKCQLLGVPL